MGLKPPPPAIGGGWLSNGGRSNNGDVVPLGGNFGEGGLSNAPRNGTPSHLHRRGEGGAVCSHLVFELDSMLGGDDTSACS